jgi:GTP-binding protein
VGPGESFPATGLPEIALAGRSNVGKSSLINTIVGRRGLAPISSTPGKTTTIRFYDVDQALVLVDLPGYGYAKVSRSLRRAWKVLVERYFASSPTLVAAVHVVDIRHPGLENDKLLWTWLDLPGVDRIMVATKADKVPRGKRPPLTKALRDGFRLGGEQVFTFSAVTGEGKDDLWRWMWGKRTSLGRGRPAGTRITPHGAGARRARLSDSSGTEHAEVG